MNEVIISIDKKLVKRIRTEITLRYGSKKNFSKIINLKDHEINNGLKYGKISVKKLCYILYHLSLTRYDINRKGLALLNAKKNIDNAKEPQWKIENANNLAIRTLSSAFSKGELTDTVEQALEKTGFYLEYKFPLNPQDWYTDKEYMNIKDIFVYALNQLDNSNLYSLYINLDAYVKINDVYWPFICLVQNLREIDIMYINDMFKNLNKHHNLQTEIFKGIKEVPKTVGIVCDNEWRRQLIDKCCLYFSETYSETKDRYVAISGLLPKLPYVLYMTEDDWRWLNKYSKFVNTDCKYPYRFSIMLLKFIEGFIKNNDRITSYISDCGTVYQEK